MGLLDTQAEQLTGRLKSIAERLGALKVEQDSLASEDATIRAELAQIADYQVFVSAKKGP